MNALLLLMGLLVLSYIGSFVVGGRAIRGFGLPSGIEYVTLGFLIGPHMLDVFQRSMVETFEPVALVAVGWLAMVVGLDYGFAGSRRIPALRMLLGTSLALFTAAAVSAAVFGFVTYFTPIRGVDRLLLSGGVGAACAETTRHAVRWVFERESHHGAFANLIEQVADAEGIVPLLATAALFALAPPPATAWHLTPWAWRAIPIALGATMGTVAALLLGRTFRRDESWGVLLGMSLVAIGTAARVSISSLATLFVMGLCIGAISRHRHELRALIAPTEKPVLLPALMLAGARIDLHASRYLPWIIGVALTARVIAMVIQGWGLRLRAPREHRPSTWLGIGLLSSGSLGIAVGLAFAFRFPGPVGDTVLAVAAAASVLGEFVGPTSLRRMLRQAGEVNSATASPVPSTTESPVRAT